MSSNFMANKTSEESDFGTFRKVARQRFVKKKVHTAIVLESHSQQIFVKQHTQCQNTSRINICLFTQKPPVRLAYNLTSHDWCFLYYKL